MQVVAAPTDSEYVALSYVWGDAGTTSDSHSKEPDFPIIVQDSIKCIDQDSVHKEHMIHKMDEVYKRAAIVIISTSGTSADDGLPGISVRRSILRELTVGSLTFRPIPLTASTFSGKPDGPHVDGLTRRDTSPGAGSSSRKDRPYSCATARLFPESIPCGVSLTDCGRSVFGLFRYLGPSLPWTYQSIPYGLGDDYLNLTYKVTEFSSRKLTHDEDSLQAFLGVLNDHRDGSRHQHHLWGIPILSERSPHSSLVALDWTHRANLTARRRHGHPSWSWAGWQGTAILPLNANIDLSMMYLDEKRSIPLETVYRDFGVKKSWPRYLYLRSKLTEVMFIPGNLVEPPQGDDYHRKHTHPAMLVILPVTEAEHMASDAFIDEPVEMMTPYPAVILNEYDPHSPLPIQERHSDTKSRATLLVMKRLDGHFERVGIVEVGSLTSYDYMDPVNLGFSSADLTTGNAQLSKLVGPNRFMEHKWRQNAEEQTICLG
ncbi:hypothetical protein PG997_001499 [Apiospora hydei]|uniref:Heterokaryon incompatibility domain-containing protein n=1 Tax=Apiospora hydei TaxID=1337664 RepID=A0ABR1XDX0_9PEZI